MRQKILIQAICGPSREISCSNITDLGTCSLQDYGHGGRLKKPLLPASPKFLWLHGLPNPAFEIRCTMALSDLLIFCSSLFPLSLTLSPEDPFVAGGRRVGERTSSLLTLGICPQRHSHFLHLHAFLLFPNPTQGTLPTLAHGSGFRNMKPVTDRLAFPFKLLLRQ